MYMYALQEYISLVKKFPFIFFFVQYVYSMKWNEIKSNVKRNKNANIVYRTEVYRISICVVVEDNDNNQSSSFHTKTIISATTR